MADELNDGKRGRLYRMLGFMADKGSSVVLDYGEDTGQWEASWITGGNRYVGVNRDVEDALEEAYYCGRAGVRASDV